MTQDKQLYNLTRRKVLAGMGAVGLASVGAGLGTSAYFSDQETFEDNRLVAGSLDMKVDWEEHYSDWSDDEAAFAEMADPATADYVLPAPLDTPDAKDIALNFVGGASTAEAQDRFWDATSVEAYPDGFVNGGPQDGMQDEFDPAFACTVLTDVGGDAPGLRSRLRTEGTFAGQTTEPGDPLVNIADVKPGDFGEVTFSFHLCDNPGYVWMNGRLVEASEGETPEAELSDPDEDVDDGGSVVELLDEIRTRLWYDENGDNQVAVGGRADVMLAVDVSGSIDGDVGDPGTERGQLAAGIGSFVDALEGAVADGTADVVVGALKFGGNSVSDLYEPGAPADFDANFSLTNGDFGGDTPLPPALDIADQALEDGLRPDSRKVVVVFTDGGPNYANATYGAGGFAAPRGAAFTADDADADYDDGSPGDSTVTAAEQDETAVVAEAVRDAGSRIVVVDVGDDPGANLGAGARQHDEYLRDEIASKQADYKNVAIDNLVNAATVLVLSTLTDQVFFEGSLREALAALSGNDGRGMPLDGDRSTQFHEYAAVAFQGETPGTDNPENDPDRDCFAGEGTTHYVGFEWWLPIDHGNQVQGDSVTFDLGFYTEQCRHNDGAGMVPEDDPDGPVVVESGAD